MRSVAIVEPYRMTRLGIAQILSQGADLTLVASVPTIAGLAGLDMDVVVLNPVDSEPAAIAALATRSAVLIVSAAPHALELRSVLEAGASGFITPDAEDADLLAAVEAVARGAFYLVAGLATQLHGQLEQRSAVRTSGLARRETETLRLISYGYTHGQIARRMGLTEATVNTYVKRIRAKLQVGNKAELTRRAIEMGFLADHDHRDPHRRPGLAAVPVPSQSA
jgi:DNA-binding NarL/FixJ family response regulator